MKITLREKLFEELKNKWELFGYISINEEENIEQEFLHFPIGTNKHDIWHWFDRQCPNNLHDDLIFPLRKHRVKRLEKQEEENELDLNIRKDKLCSDHTQA